MTDPAATQPAADLSRLGIGKVLDELSSEFPSLTISKIRYLESEGLLEPDRTPAGYRKFSFADVERLRFILRQQAAPNFWPLSHIRQVLDEMDRGHVPDTELGEATRVPRLRLADDGLPTAETFAEPASRLRLTRIELIESSGLAESELGDAEDFGLIRRRPRQTYYDGDDLQVAALLAELGELGLEPRHLRAFVAAADREADLADQVATPRSREGETIDPAVARLGSLFVRLHTVLVRRRLRG